MSDLDSEFKETNKKITESEDEIKLLKSRLAGYIKQQDEATTQEEKAKVQECINSVDGRIASEKSDVAELRKQAANLKAKLEKSQAPDVAVSSVQVHTDSGTSLSSVSDSELSFLKNYKLWTESLLPCSFSTDVIDSGFKWDISSKLIETNDIDIHSTSPKLNTSIALYNLLNKPIKQPIPSKHSAYAPNELTPPNATNIFKFPYIFNTLIHYATSLSIPSDYCNESAYHQLYDCVITQPLYLLSSIDKDINKIQVKCDRDTNGNIIHSNSTTIKPSLRPDNMIYFSGCAFIIGEERSASNPQSVLDLTDKLLPFSPFIYNQLPFVIAYCTSGNILQFYALYGNKSYGYERPLLITPEYDLSRLNDRISVILLMLKFYLLYKHFHIAQLTPSLSKLSIGTLHHKPHVMVYSKYIIKYTNTKATSNIYSKLNNLSYFKSTGKLETIYEEDDDQKNVQLPFVTITEELDMKNNVKIIQSKEFMFKLRITPVALTISTYSVTCLEQLKLLTKQVGNTLAIIHNEQICHCDIREENIFYFANDIYGLGDFECSVPKDTVQNIHIRLHHPDWKQGQVWSTAYDVWQFKEVIIRFLQKLQPAKADKVRQSMRTHNTIDALTKYVDNLK